MADFKDNLEKFKDAAKGATKKVQESDAFGKVKDAASGAVQKIKENETVKSAAEKVKETAKGVSEKAQESEAFGKVKEAASDAAQKIKENETVANVTEKINQNEYVQKINKHKNGKWIKLGAAFLAIILVISLLGAIFSDKNAKLAEEAVEKELDTYDLVANAMFDSTDVSVLYIKTKTIKKNKKSKDKFYYCVDTEITAEKNGKKVKGNCYYIVCVSKGEAVPLEEFIYTAKNKSKQKKAAFAVCG